VLARRIAPFLLRRTKNEVALELPPKTEMVRRVELTPSQKDLYETVRAAMDARVKSVVASKGLAGSHIIVLDALLKMRQVCCHPLLLKSYNARKIADSAKLDALLEMLDEMIPEGRRVLIFSQFTSMLQLIEEALNARNIGYVQITGQTKDRKKPVNDFQIGKVPVFLISLKAGGTGLNLTAADTVIHFDPWWNPAAEAQATDRAYRIGQDKPVFVYKLIAAESVEERVLQMQVRKKDLIDGLLGDQKEALKKWSEEDLEDLFKPMA
jgi:SNF2 family DNA or RNA helicase